MFKDYIVIKEGKLNKKEINSQVHFLTINQEDEFNKIYNFLEEMWSLVDKMENATGKMKITPRKMKTKKTILEEIVKFRSSFLSPSYDAIHEILFRLLGRIKANIHSEIDSNILYSKIVEILSNPDSDLPPGFDVLNLIVNHNLKEARSSPMFEAADIDPKVIDDIK